MGKLADMKTSVGQDTQHKYSVEMALKTVEVGGSPRKMWIKEK